jgi:hypothetical protein
MSDRKGVRWTLVGSFGVMNVGASACSDDDSLNDRAPASSTPGSTAVSETLYRSNSRNEAPSAARTPGTKTEWMTKVQLTAVPTTSGMTTAGTTAPVRARRPSGSAHPRSEPARGSMSAT